MADSCIPSHSAATTPFLAPPPSRAAIIGGGFAGLLAAASLSPHFDEITILERDQVPTTASEARKIVEQLRESAEGALEYARVRRGVPQFLHCHGWLAGGLRAMNELLPGFTDDAVRAGAVPLEKARARTFFGDTEVHPPQIALESKELSLIATRALHESVLLWRVLRDKRNVTIRAKTGVDGLIFSSDKKEVEGVTLSTGEALLADLVIDASGGRGFAKSWLSKGGYGTPSEVKVDQRSAWTTCFYDLPPQIINGWKRMFNRPAFPNRHGCVLMQVEGNRYLVGLNEIAAGPQPREENEFRASVEKLPHPAIWQVVKHGTPLTPPVTFRGGANLRRRYENCPLPERFCVLGDALTVFNPRFGQGMSVAARQAREMGLQLEDFLKKQGHQRPSGDNLKGFGKVYHAAAAEIVSFPFSLVTGWDRMYPTTQCNTPPSWQDWFWSAYISQLWELTTFDAQVWQGTEDVVQMVAEPRTLLVPSILLKVIRQSAQKGLIDPIVQHLRSWNKSAKLS